MRRGVCGRTLAVDVRACACTTNALSRMPPHCRKSPCRTCHDLRANVEHREKTAHPLRRVMDIAPRGDELEVSTTDVRLAQDICDALVENYDGKLNVDYDEGERLLRVKWLA